MQVGILGINHKSASLSLREKLAKACEKRLHPGRSIHLDCSYILLSTCNRTELYFSSPDLAQTHTYLLEILRYEVEEEFEHHIYSYFGRDCFYHLACVTTGLDSAMLGETEIQGQVKKAYQSASLNLLSPPLHFMFQKCLKIGKDIRSLAYYRDELPTIEEAVYQAGRVQLGDLSTREILFIGVSEINCKVFLHLRKQGVKSATFCNRTAEKVTSLGLGTFNLPWEQLHEWPRYDLIICATKSPHFLIHKEIQPLKHTVLIDLSVPRNIDPALSRQKNISLFNIDQLNKLTQRKGKINYFEIFKMKNELIYDLAKKQVAIYKLKELQKSHLYYHELKLSIS